MTPTISPERLERFLKATPEQQEMVDRVLEGHLAAKPTPTPFTTAPAFPPELLTKKEVAARAKVTTRTIENWTRAGVIPVIKVKKVTLFCWDDVVRHLKAHHQICRRTLRA